MYNSSLFIVTEPALFIMKSTGSQDKSFNLHSCNNISKAINNQISSPTLTNPLTFFSLRQSQIGFVVVSIKWSNPSIIHSNVTPKQRLLCHIVVCKFLKYSIILIQQQVCSVILTQTVYFLGTSRLVAQLTKWCRLALYVPKVFWKSFIEVIFNKILCIFARQVTIPTHL